MGIDKYNEECRSIVMRYDLLQASPTCGHGRLGAPVLPIYVHRVGLHVNHMIFLFFICIA